ncbi:MAG: HNH endonuclease [Candidatus Viridilinea halotolerans]|uniref:HNH endonuclease n=1 Tax=Candidatus Viridilinea halotolerans TaxID=2491704 RepID=A0A426UA74_9CHLR|nr:MAG: HNH endonuclease [Candidatus Viridilinea halotolerans]
MIYIEEIAVIKKSAKGSGYDIIFNDGRIIWMTKARTIIALLVLIKYGEGSESDLAKGSSKILEIKQILHGKYPEKLFKDYYSDANKPFSELWNEEGFVWIRQPSGLRINRSQTYVLAQEDHDKLFLPVRKALRRSLLKDHLDIIQRLPNRCNLCGAKITRDCDIKTNSFSRDRLRRRIDHRIPVEKGGDSESEENFQLLCFYCNKSKWQICNICDQPHCEQCVLAFSERTTEVFPTGEDITDRMQSV